MTGPGPDVNQGKGGDPDRRRRIFSMAYRRRKNQFTVKQYLVMLLIQPLSQGYKPCCKSIRKDLHAGLDLYFGIDRTMRHVNRLLADLQQEGIIKKEISSFYPFPGSPPMRYEWFRVVEFDKAFQDLFSLMRAFHSLWTKEKRRRKRRQARGKGENPCM